MNSALKSNAAPTPTAAGPGTISWDELQRLSFANSPKLPQRVNYCGRARMWMGNGWMEIGPAQPGDMVVLEDA